MYLHGLAGALASSQGLMVKICRHVGLKKQRHFMASPDGEYYD
jgi:hypothetical protein